MFQHTAAKEGAAAQLPTREGGRDMGIGRALACGDCNVPSITIRTFADPTIRDEILIPLQAIAIFVVCSKPPNLSQRTIMDALPLPHVPLAGCRE